MILRLARRWFRVTAEYEGHKFFVRRESVLIERTPQSDSIPTGRSLSPDPSFLIAGEEGRVTGPVRCSSTLKARWFVTPLFLVLVVVETTDVAFAADSIPAIFAVTRDPFIVFTSNIFAILGLRALYFLLAGTMDLFRYLSVGLAAILCFVGTKMLISGFYHIPVGVSLGVVCSMLAVAVGASLLVSKSESGRVMSRPHDRDEPAEVTEQQVAIKV